MPNVGGARRDWSNVIVDGVVANEVGASNRMAQQINLDAIAEVKVLLNTYRAEYGRAGGGQVQIVSKSGSSKYHGNLYYYGRHESLNATNFFNNRAQREKPRYRFNTYGANLGGPVPGLGQEAVLLLLDRSAAGQPARARSATGRCRPSARCAGTSRRRSTAQGRLIFIRDPLREGLQRARAATRASPATSFRPIASTERPALLNMLPRANNFDRTFTQGQFNHSTQENAENPKLNNIVRVDWRPTATDSFYFTFKDWYRISAAARSPPARPSGASSTPTT